jgi:hypothetical protein
MVVVGRMPRMALIGPAIMSRITGMFSCVVVSAAEVARTGRGALTPSRL